MLAFHHVDESLGEGDRGVIARFAIAFEAQQCQSGHRREDRKAPVERVRHSAVDIPVPPSRLSGNGIEQRRTAGGLGG